jgi:hypothetical protein
MLIPLLATPGLPELLGAGYLLAGTGVALKLRQKAMATSTVFSAVVCWPLYLGLLTETPPQKRTGPLSDRIHKAFEVLAEAELDVAETTELRRTLEAADARLAKVDQLLAQDLAYSGDALEHLKTARARAAAEIESVLDGVVELRIQAGLLELAGDTAPVAARLRELRTRVEAIHEIGAL